MNQSNQSGKIYSMVLLAVFTAIIFLLAFTPIGLIDLPLIKATILHVPVIIGAILLGPKRGAFLGFMFGLTSIIKNTIAPSMLSFAFSPLIPVPGLDRGSAWAIVICFVPRIAVGVTPWLVCRGVERIRAGHPTVRRSVGMVLGGIVGAFTNTILVMGMIFLVFRSAYAAASGIPVNTVLGAILAVVAANGIPEAIVAAILTPVVSLPLQKVLKPELLCPAKAVQPPQEP